jgi:2-dehydro-3-deoxyphosphogluconate aldolase/(4S)-4-hydroxy-2-oxoglutarate aldolase
MPHVFEEIRSLSVVPVIKITDASRAVPLAKALADGGLPCAEVTFRTKQAGAAIRNIVQAMPEMLVGAGTVLTTAQADEAAASGAKFIVAPGLNPEVVRHCQKIGLPVLPGCCTPSEIEQALSLGLTVLKFFPAEAAGGLKMVKALAAPYGEVRFVPTGGLGPDNLASYLSFDKVLACGGSWMVKEDWIEAGDFGKIRQATAEAMELVNKVRK